MNTELLKLEKNFFDIKYMKNIEYLNNHIDDEYLEVGKSGFFINKTDVIKELSNLKENRNIDIYNFSQKQIDENTYIAHYITLNKEQEKIYRTSIWKKEENFKILFHQASILTDDIILTKM